MGRASCCGIRKQIKAVLFCWLVVNASISMEAAAAAVSLGTIPFFVSNKPIKCLHLEALEGVKNAPYLLSLPLWSKL
ncbi:unnamed protein product [Musa textilis]